MSDVLDSVGDDAGGWETTIAYANSPGLLARARHDVRSTMNRHRLPASTVNDAVLLADELVTNALTTDSPHVVVTLRGITGLLRIDVADSATGYPDRPGPGAFTDFGLDVVDAVGSGWGCRSTAEGRYIWVTIEHD